ncbi:MAG: hypothetical protein DDG60_01850, partial [Anaerolineae bacterium]
VLEVLTRAFYAQQDTRTPVVVGAFAMSLNVVFSFVFSSWFKQIGWMPHGGLALANSLATALETALLFVIMSRRLGGMETQSLLDGVLRMGTAACGMALALWVWMQATSSISLWLNGLGGVLLGGVVYSAGVLLFRIPEVNSLLVLVKRRLPGQ